MSNLSEKNQELKKMKNKLKQNKDLRNNMSLDRMEVEPVMSMSKFYIPVSSDLSIGEQSMQKILGMKLDDYDYLLDDERIQREVPLNMDSVEHNKVLVFKTM